MFAYCGNDPANKTDPDGKLPYPGFIHNKVVQYIAKKYSFFKEQIIKFSDGFWGRADLISESGAVWEVKPNKNRHIKKGKEQVNNYVNNVWTKFPNTKLSVGGEIDPDMFSFKEGFTTYYVSYCYVGDGVIVYDYNTETDWEAVKTTAGWAAVIICLAYLTVQTGGATAPAFGGALHYMVA